MSNFTNYTNIVCGLKTSYIPHQQLNNSTNKQLNNYAIPHYAYQRLKFSTWHAENFMKVFYYYCY